MGAPKQKLEWTHVKPEMIHDHKGIRFWRWSLTLQCKEEEQASSCEASFYQKTWSDYLPDLLLYVLL
eukprot:1158263-Pelagomonas_calceolata.AAC.11